MANEKKTKKVCKLEPVGSVFNVDRKFLEKETKNALTELGVDNIATVKAIFDEKGRVSIYAFIKTWSSVIETSKVNAPKNIAHKIEGNGKNRFTAEGKEILSAFTANNPRIGSKGNEMYVELNVFKCLADMLAVDVCSNRIVISETAKTTDGRCVMTVIVQNLNSMNEDKNDEEGNNYSKFIERLENHY